MKELLWVDSVDLTPGDVIPVDDLGTGSLYQRDELKPLSSVQITKPQTAWCFGVKVITRYDYYDETDYTSEYGRVEYEYPCYSLGNDNPNGLEYLIGELQPDGTVSLTVYEYCGRLYWQKDQLSKRLDCMNSISELPLDQRQVLVAK